MDLGNEDGSHGGATNYSVISKKVIEIVHSFSNSPSKIIEKNLSSFCQNYMTSQGEKPRRQML